MTDPCDCCTGVAQQTPQLVENRSGLPAIAYRAGTHSQFLSTMLAAVGTVTAHGLRTRDPDDFSIAFFDSCAIVADVLTFYNERIANENYLRTATELRSISELARLIGYALRPGCAASAFLAFRLNDPPANADPSAPDKAQAALMTLSSALGVVIPAGTKVQSVPGPNQLPQIFETSGDLDARWVANALPPRRTRAYPPGSTGIDAIYLPEGAVPPKVGDRVLLSDKNTGAVSLRTVTATAPVPAAKVTRAVLEGGSPPATLVPPPPATIPAADGPFGDELVGKIVNQQSWDRDELATLIARRSWSVDAFEATVNAARQANPAGDALTCHAVGSGAALFGHNAPPWTSLPPIMRYQYTDTATQKTVDPAWEANWDGTTIGTYALSSWHQNTTIDLDTVYPSVVGGLTIVFIAGSTVITARVSGAQVVSRAAYGMTARVTNIALAEASGGDPGTLDPRTTAVFVQDAAIPLAPIPISAAISGTGVLLDRAALHLAKGGFVALTGERIDRVGRSSVEVAQIAKAILEDGFTRLTFERPLDGAYAGPSVLINANVIAATNGETVAEAAIGNGDAASAFQKFALPQVSAALPLTWTSAPVADGVDAAITVRVNGVEWKRAPYLYGSAPTDRVFALGTDIDGKTVVQFGDGAASGARLPSGSENVRAQYRRGLGAAGLVAAGQLSMLITRPPGVRDVTNPLDANGAADLETAAQSRVNAPFAVRTLDRIVTLDDYADFARASAAIAKARVDLAWRGAQRVIILTVAGPAGAPVVDPSPQHDDLLTALSGAAEADFPIALKSYRPRTFTVAAGLRVDPAYRTEDVYAAARSTLAGVFSFDRREFGQPVFKSEVIAAIQAVAGVISSNLTLFRYADDPAPSVQDRLDAQPAALSGSDAVGAELLTIERIPPVLAALA
jgi:hypothetical protein